MEADHWAVRGFVCEVLRQVRSLASHRPGQQRSTTSGPHTPPQARARVREIKCKKPQRPCRRNRQRGANGIEVRGQGLRLAAVIVVRAGGRSLAPGSVGEDAAGVQRSARRMHGTPRLCETKQHTALPPQRPRAAKSDARKPCVSTACAAIAVFFQSVVISPWGIGPARLAIRGELLLSVNAW
eukprot:3941100-Rhodomonas_salina.2